MSAPNGSSRKLSSTSGRTQPTRTSKTSPYSGQYEVGLNDAHVYLEGHNYGTDDQPEPKNLHEIQQRLMAGRASLSPSRTAKDFKQFKRESAKARSETRMAQMTMAYISGKDDHFKTEADVEFNNIQPFNQGLAAPKPDLYDRVLISTVYKQVRDDLITLIIPSTDTTKPIAPSFFMEAKSEKGRADVAKKRACHDGAIGDRAMHSLQNYGVEEPVYDGNAYSFTTTYHNGQMQLYATHPTAPTTAGEPPEYHMAMLNSYAMTGNHRNFREGATAYRNARDMAKKVRESFIKQANKVAAGMPVETPSTNRHSNHTPGSAAPDLDSDTSLDELALDVTIKAKRSRRPVASHDDDDETGMSFMKPEAEARRAIRYIPGDGNQTSFTTTVAELPPSQRHMPEDEDPVSVAAEVRASRHRTISGRTDRQRQYTQKKVLDSADGLQRSRGQQ